MMRTEEDLRAAFRDLARCAPEPDDVLRAVYRPGRRPRRRMWAGLIAGAAVAVTAAAVAVATVPGPARRGGPVSGPVLRARLLAAIDGARGDILSSQTQLSGPGESGPGSGTGHSQTLTSPWYPRPGQRVRVHTLGYGSDGTLGKDFEYIFTMPAKPGASNTDPIDATVWGGEDLTVTGSFLAVFRATRTWGEWHRLTLNVELAADAAGIRQAISQGRLTVVGHGEVDGHQAIELGIPVPAGTGTTLRVTSARLWVDAVSYLPLRQSLLFSDGKRTVTDYTFLPPTAANLARLRPVIPAGYQRTTRLPGQRPSK